MPSQGPQTSQPAPRRQMRGKITRVRTGCHTCRQRRVKCDEGKPKCTACNQLGLDCEGYAPRYKFLEAAPVAHDRHRTFKSIEWAAITEPETRPLRPSPSQNFGATDQSPSPADSASVSISEQSDSGPCPSPDTYTLGGGESDTFAPHAPESIGTSSPAVSKTPVASSISPSGNLTSDLGSNTQQTETSHLLPLILDNITPTSLDDYYFAQWRNEVAALLPPAVRSLVVDIPEFIPLKYAVLAISAAHLAHVESSMVFSTRYKRRSRYVPQKDHQYQSLRYYNKGIRELSESFTAQPSMPAVFLLATSLLFHYFELDSGSFMGGIGHMDGIEKLLSSHYDELNSTSTGRDLLCATMSLHSVFINRCIVGGSKRPTLHSEDLSFLPNVSVPGANFKAGTPYDSITILMFDCMVTERKIILDWCVCRTTPPHGGASDVLSWLLSQMQLPETRDDCTSEELIKVDSSYREALTRQRASLDEWHSSLSLSELPMDPFVSCKQALFEEAATGLEIYPVKFRDFDSAMNYAYYAACQILSSPNMLERLYRPTDITTPFSRKNYPWEKLILRIAAGLEFADCIYRNTFRTGMVSLLTLCIISCPNPNVALWVEKWIECLEQFGIPLESGLPFQMAKRVGRVLAQQKQRELDIFLLAPLNTGHVEKADLYQSDFPMQIVVCGKDRRTGRLYSDTLDIP